MQTIDHLSLAKHMMKFMKREKRHRAAFLLGNIMPDFNPLSYFYPFDGNWFQGHSFRGKQKFISRRLFSKYRPTMFWWYLNGKAMHYLADAFTRPHHTEFSYTKESHAKYEEKLHNYFEGCITSENLGLRVKVIPKEQRFLWILKLHEAYIKDNKDIEADYDYITEAAAFALGWLWEASGEKCYRLLIRKHLRRTLGAGRLPYPGMFRMSE